MQYLLLFFFRLTSFLILCNFVNRCTSRKGSVVEICGLLSHNRVCCCNYTIGFLVRDW